MKDGSRGTAYDCQIDSQKQQSNQQIPFPMIAQGDSERESGEEADDVRDVRDVRIVAGDPALFVNHDDVVDEVNDRDQSLGREEKPGKLERPHEHHARCQSEDCGRGAEHSRPAGQEGRAEDEACEAAGEKDRQELARTDGFFQCATEDE